MVKGQVLDFAVSGLLRASNLVMYDRQTESWWQEVTGEAVVGELTGSRLELLPWNLVSWKEFKEAFPDGKVLSRNTGHSLPYGQNPYILYDTSYPFLLDGPADGRLPAIERVVGIEIGGEALAVPYTALKEERVVEYELGEQDLVVFYHKGLASALDDRVIARGRDVGAASVFDPHLDGEKLTFKLQDGRVVDTQTGSTWSLLGNAEAGPLAGRELRPLPFLPAPFWFSWVVFRPYTQVYRGAS